MTQPWTLDNLPFFGSCENLDTKSFPDGSVSEMYSPPRVAPRACRFGFSQGASMDLTTTDENGIPWDFTCPDRRKAALAYIKQHRPLLIVGSPMCRMFSQMMRVNRKKMGELRYRRELRAAVDHVIFMLQVYELQMQEGRYFVHEHPPASY